MKLERDTDRAKLSCLMETLTKEHMKTARDVARSCRSQTLLLCSFCSHKQRKDLINLVLSLYIRGHISSRMGPDTLENGT